MPLFQITKQMQEMWCWAAVAASVDRYFSAATSWSQCRIVASALNIANCCEDSDACNIPWKLPPALKIVQNFDSQINGPLPFKELRKHIDRHLPVCARIGWYGGGGHFVIITGYQVTAAGVPLLHVADPWFPNSTVAYEEFKCAYQNSQSLSGGGCWTHTYLVKP